VLVHLILLGSSALCFFIGIIKYIGRRKALFCTLISAAMGCFMMGHLCEFLFLLMQGAIPGHFHIGMLARAGSYSFLFSASFAQMDGLVDDRVPSIRTYRIMSLAAPAWILLIYLPVLFFNISAAQKIWGGVLVICAALPAYYHLKHLIIPDVSQGIIASIRGYSASALLLETLSVIRLTADKLGKTTVGLVAGLILAASYIITFFAMEKGRKKWTI